MNQEIQVTVKLTMSAWCGTDDDIKTKEDYTEAVKDLITNGWVEPDPFDNPATLRELIEIEVQGIKEEAEIYHPENVKQYIRVEKPTEYEIDSLKIATNHIDPESELRKGLNTLLSKLDLT